MCSAFCITWSLVKCWNGFSLARLITSHRVTANDQTLLEQVYLSWNRNRASSSILLPFTDRSRTCSLNTRTRFAGPTKIISVLPAECFPTAAIWLAPAVCRLCHCNPSCKGHCTSLCRSLSRCKSGPLDSFWLPGLCAPDSSTRGTSCPMLSAPPCTSGSFDWKYNTKFAFGSVHVNWPVRRSLFLKSLSKFSSFVSGIIECKILQIFIYSFCRWSGFKNFIRFPFERMRIIISQIAKMLYSTKRDTKRML